MAKKAKAAKSAAATEVMPQRVAINPFGPTEPRKIVKSKLLESEFTLDDGSKITMKPLIGDVRRAVGQYNENGEPLYFLTVGHAISTKAPKLLKKPSEQSKTKKKKAKKK